MFYIGDAEERDRRLRAYRLNLTYGYSFSSPACVSTGVDPLNRARDGFGKESGTPAGKPGESNSRANADFTLLDLERMDCIPARPVNTCCSTLLPTRRQLTPLNGLPVSLDRCKRRVVELFRNWQVVARLILVHSGSGALAKNAVNIGWIESEIH